MTGETFGQMLRRLRIERALSQNALARAAGVDPAYVNRIESGVYRDQVRRGVVLSLANALDLSDSLTDRFLFAAGLAPEQDWQSRAVRAETALATIRQAFDDAVDPYEIEEPPFIRRRTG